MAEEDNTPLIGKNLELSLNLKHASEGFLLFRDTRIVIEENTKYYLINLIKWNYGLDDIKELVGKSDMICRVQGKIIEVVSRSTSSHIPYIIVE